MTEADKKLWQEMADMTLERCRKRCHFLGSCCEKAYCDFTKDFAERQGVKLVETGNAVPFLDESGKCVVPPHLRPLCSLHQCDISGLGFATQCRHDESSDDDPAWTKRYFELRDKLAETVE